MPTPLSWRDRLLKWYAAGQATRTGAQAAAGMLAVAGEPLPAAVVLVADALFGLAGQNIQQRRTERDVQTLMDAVADLAEESVNKAYLESEEFHDLALQYFEKGRRTRVDERTRRYARLLRGAIEDPKFRLVAETGLELISEVGEEEFLVLARLWKLEAEYGILGLGSVMYEDKYDCEIPAQVANRLVAVGLLIPRTKIDRHRFQRAVADSFAGRLNRPPETEISYHLSDLASQMMEKLAVFTDEAEPMDAGEEKDETPDLRQNLGTTPEKTEGE